MLWRKGSSSAGTEPRLTGRQARSVVNILNELFSLCEQMGFAASVFLLRKTMIAWLLGPIHAVKIEIEFPTRWEGNWTHLHCMPAYSAITILQPSYYMYWLLHCIGPLTDQRTGHWTTFTLWTILTYSLLDPRAVKIIFDIHSEHRWAGMWSRDA
jgi:hypothetical protein